MELTNNIRKIVASLSATKHRRQTNAFKAEGAKCVLDTLPHFNLRMLLATNEWLLNNDVQHVADKIIKVTTSDLQRMSDMVTAPPVIAVYNIPSYEINLDNFKQKLVLALDSIQDPGNLGTIIRTADWFGISDIFCTQTTADVFSPKVVQATMGAISRVRVHYCNLSDTLNKLKSFGNPIYGTFLDGTNIYSSSLTPSGVIVMGNEGQGISPNIEQIVTHKLFIPSYPLNIPTSESLNVGVATAITLSEFRRNNFK